MVGGGGWYAANPCDSLLALAWQSLVNIFSFYIFCILSKVIMNSTKSIVKAIKIVNRKCSFVLRFIVNSVKAETPELKITTERFPLDIFTI